MRAIGRVRVEEMKEQKERCLVARMLPEPRERLRERGRAFSAEKVTDQYLEVITSMCTAKRSEARGERGGI